MEDNQKNKEELEIKWGDKSLKSISPGVMTFKIIFMVLTFLVVLVVLIKVL